MVGVESILRWIVILVYGVTLFSNNYDNIYHLLVFGFYVFVTLGLAKKIYDKDISLPSFTPANIAIIALVLLLEFVFYIFSPLDKFLWFMILEKLLSVFILILVLSLGVFFDFSTDLVINQAIKKIQKHKRLLTIAVVGSYGRGSTKEFIARVLSQRYNVLETKTSFDNASGIAKTILSGLTAKKQIFIAEMDDYKKGDIGEMSAIIKPSIAVVCGINEQKMSVLGSIDNIVSSKYELIEALSKDAVALFNGNSEYSVDLYNKTNVKKFIYSVEKKDSTSAIRASNIKESKFDVSFDVYVLGKKYKLSGIKLLGGYNIENLLPAILIGTYVSIDFSQIKKALLDIKPLPGAMNPSKISNGTVVIDDTYNANINSVLRAVSYTSIYKGKKVMVLEPLLGLGNFAAREHEALGQEIGKVCDFLFLTNDNYYKGILQGIAASKSKCRVYRVPPAKIINFINTQCKAEDVVVFEGPGAKNSLSFIRKDPIY